MKISKIFDEFWFDEIRSLRKIFGFLAFWEKNLRSKQFFWIFSYFAWKCYDFFFVLFYFLELFCSRSLFFFLIIFLFFVSLSIFCFFTFISFFSRLLKFYASFRFFLVYFTFSRFFAFFFDWISSILSHFSAFAL